MYHKDYRTTGRVIVYDNIIFGRKLIFEAYTLELFFSSLTEIFPLKEDGKYVQKGKTECEKHARVYYVTREKHFQISHKWS